MNPTQASSAPQAQPGSVPRTNLYQQKLQEINKQLSDTYSSPNNSEDKDQEEEEEEEGEGEEEEEEEDQIKSSWPQVLIFQNKQTGEVLYEIPALPRAFYNSKEEMMTSIEGFAWENGFVIVVCRSDK